jgi:hypothetical protein
MNFRCHGIFGAALLAFGASTAFALGGPCDLLKLPDLTGLLGPAAAVQSSNKSICLYVDKDAKPSSYPRTTSVQIVPPLPEMAIAMMRKKVESEGKVADESGLGDKAFSVITSAGVMVFAFKGGQALQLVYLSGKPGKAAELEALRQLTRKAYAAL